MRVGILTFHNALNYGAVAQAYALFSFLKEKGYEVQVIDYQNPYFIEGYINSNFFFKTKGIKRKVKWLGRFVFRHRRSVGLRRWTKSFFEFINENIDLTSPCTRENISKIVDDLDCVIVGSDQVWNIKLNNNDLTYFLDFVKDSKKKKSYAASMRINIPDSEKETIKKYVSQFSSVLVREKASESYLLDLGIKSSTVLDPTFLLNKNFWLNFCKDEKKDKRIKRDYIFMYMVYEPTHLYEEAYKLAKANNLDLVIIGYKAYKMEGIHIYNASLKEYIYYLANAKYVFNTSFHGIAFSINLNKEFYYELGHGEYKNNIRVQNITEALGLTGREITDKGLDTTPISWSKVNETLEQLKVQSISLLESSLRQDNEK